MVHELLSFGSLARVSRWQEVLKIYFCIIFGKLNYQDLPRSPIIKKYVNAGIAQLVEHNLAKVGVASSSLVSRSIKFLIK